MTKRNHSNDSVTNSSQMILLLVQDIIRKDYEDVKNNEFWGII